MSKLVILAGGISSRMKNKKEIQQISTQVLKDVENKTKSMIGIGEKGRPFLDYLLDNIKEAGYTDITIVDSESDHSIRDYYANNRPDSGVYLSFVSQNILPGRKKPLGTADALLQALTFRKDWQGCTFTVCNSDNLYSVKSLKLIKSLRYQNTIIGYDRAGLHFNKNRVEQFAVIRKDKAGFLTKIIEKPSSDQIEKIQNYYGCVEISMNLFSLDYDMILPCLENVKLHPVRLEKELPESVLMMVKKYPKSVHVHSIKEHVPDLTSPDDIFVVKEYLEKD